MPQEKMPQEKQSNRHLLSRYWASASGFWRGKSANTNWLFAVGLVTVNLVQLAVQYRLNYWNRDFFNALGSRDAEELWHQAAIFMPLACLSVGLSVTSVWGRMTTQLRWRNWLTTHVLSVWLSANRYRLLKSVAGEYKNAEYRIAVDVRLATDSPVDMALGLVTSALTAAVFIGVLWNVGDSFPVNVGGMQLTIPGYLVIGVCIYSAIFTTVVMAVGHRFPAVVQLQTQAEAEFLAAANDIRRLGDGTGAKDGEMEKQTPVWRALRQVVVRWRQLIWQIMGTTMVSQTDLLLAPVCAWVLCAPKYLSGMMTLGELTQASAAFVAVQAAFNWLVDNYPRLSDWLAAAYRLANLLLALDAITPDFKRDDIEIPVRAMKAP